MLPGRVCNSGGEQTVNAWLLWDQWLSGLECCSWSRSCTCKNYHKCLQKNSDIVLCVCNGTIIVNTLMSRYSVCSVIYVVIFSTRSGIKLRYSVNTGP